MQGAGELREELRNSQARREKYEKEGEINNLARANEPRPGPSVPRQPPAPPAVDTSPATRPSYNNALTGSNSVPIGARKETQLQPRPATPYRHPSPSHPPRRGSNNSPVYRVPPPVILNNQLQPSVPLTDPFVFTVPTVTNTGEGTFGSMF